ncbi:MAG TPA: glycoside hydrolase family 15 protein [Steroidobacteraceae bacterium]|nr:glycoside hydrolase family 15 protein [Steroidobacteraceae bacterium]
MPLHIEDYALIGDLETAALVGRDGSIDWLCWPRFDSDACFCALLGTSDHGRWLIGPADEPTRVTRRYRENTLILETRFETASGVVVVTDFMPPRDGVSDLIRSVRCEMGEVRMRTELVIRFGYGITVPWVTRTAPGTWHAVAGPDMLILHTRVPLRGEGLKQVGSFVLRAGESTSFTLEHSPSHLPPGKPIDVERALQDTDRYWRDWVAKAEVDGPWSAQVTRSLITLRALIYNPTGGIVAAPTTSLPEHLGGERNWDYRFCWLRDATLTLLAFMDAGYYDEAEAWRHWLLRAIAGSPRQLQIMYGVAGERRLTEWEVAWLPGYENSRPVRIGNGAYGQLQLDVFGEVMDALHQARDGGLAPLPGGWDVQRELLAHLLEIWHEPDYGIWEVRGPPQHFTYSKIMAWVAFDRAVKDAERYALKGPIAAWRAARDRIHAEVCERGYDRKRQSFMQAYGSDQLDASLLLAAPVGFLPPNDERIRGTVRAIETHLLRDGLVQRYDSAQTDDGLPAGEGSFLACSFWLVDAYAMDGRLDEAKALFERLLTIANDVGLFAEEYDAQNKRMIGNFPQAFSHLSLVVSALNLTNATKPAEQRSEKPMEQHRPARQL